MRHSPTLLPQAPPPPGLPSSVRESQSSSMALQISVLGPMPPTHEVHVPLLQARRPGRQAPTLLPHASIWPSVTPSQSSSSPLHVSTPGGVSPTHAPQLPDEHVWVPGAQIPRLLPQALVSASSTVPSQSLSRLSHISGIGLAQLQAPSSITPSQSLSVRSHVSEGGRPQVPHRFRNPSSTLPLQLSSMLSQMRSPGSVQSVCVVIPLGRSQ